MENISVNISTYNFPPWMQKSPPTLMAAYAALVSLMNIIHDLQHHPSPPISLDRQLVDPITKHITFFLEFLEAYNPPPSADEDEAADPLEMRIADAAYAAEDAIETHIVDIIKQQQSNYDDGSKITRLMNFFRALKKPKNQIDEKLKSINLCRDSLQLVIEEMMLIEKVVVENVDAEKKKYVVVHDQVALKNVPSFVARNCTMVGSDGSLREILEMLGGQPDRQVIPIVGMGGIGKTFLARSVYAQPHIKDRFDICAWATISQQYNTREILWEVLSQATNTKKEQLSGKSEDVLGLELHKYLFSRRFLIVMDDMWSIDAWDKIQHYFPDKSNGSRVLVTTRLSQLCSQLNNNYSLPMSFLDEVSSWDLFSRTVFGDTSCPPVLKKIAEKIVENCRGLPLSIVVVGGLLKNMDDTQRSWESIRDNLTSVVNMENDKDCLRLLKLSYNHLPVYLKSCFLYMGVFEEDAKIRVSTIVKLWMAEGFLRPRNGESLKTTARGLLQDLVDRNLILIDELGSTGSIKSCKIHDLLRDLCLKESQKYGFYHVIGKCNHPSQGMNTQRRIVIPKNTSKKKVLGDLRTMSNARSIICERAYFPPHPNLGLLRYSLSHARCWLIYRKYFRRFCYVKLRRLFLEARGISSFLPSVSLLWNLHTLIVSCLYKVLGDLRTMANPHTLIVSCLYKVLGDLRTMANPRSIICERAIVPPHLNLGLLRLFHAYEYCSIIDTKYLNFLLFHYVNLRHLDIKACGIPSFLPSLCLLWNLHTLIVSGTDNAHRLGTLFADIWKMPQFRHIEFVYNYVSLPDPPSVVQDDDVIVMENLHTLKGVMNFNCSEGVVKRIPNIKKLKLRYHGLLGTDNNYEHCLGNIKSLCGLESLAISLGETNIYIHKLTFPHSLKKLTLEMDYDLEWDDMLEKIGSLPHLEKLMLYGGRFGKGTWETFEGQFPCLKYLELFGCSGLEHWTAAEEGSSILPSLRYLVLSGLKRLEKIPSELGNISTLKKIVIIDCVEGAVKSAKEMFDEQVDLQGGEDQLSFHVLVCLYGRNEHLLSLAGPNFEVQ